VDGQRHAPTTLSTGKTRYPLRGRLGGSYGRYGRVWKISPPPGFDPRTVQPVASRYTDYATRSKELQYFALMGASVTPTKQVRLVVKLWMPGNEKWKVGVASSGKIFVLGFTKIQQSAKNISRGVSNPTSWCRMSIWNTKNVGQHNRPQRLPFVCTIFVWIALAVSTLKKFSPWRLLYLLIWHIVF